MNDQQLLDEFGKQLIAETKRRISEESIERIKKCLDMITNDQIWQRPNKESNSIGNLILHLCGNARQWLICGLTDAPDTRNRSLEFDIHHNISKSEFITKLDELSSDIASLLKMIDVSNLVLPRKVQVFEETGISILIHVIEHFSYHTGQIVFYTKLLTNKPTNFYSHLNLEINDTK